jgi:hypothetical protein
VEQDIRVEDVVLHSSVSLFVYCVLTGFNLHPYPHKNQLAKIKTLGCKPNVE